VEPPFATEPISYGSHGHGTDTVRGDRARRGSCTGTVAMPTILTKSNGRYLKLREA
jgi:hypothetical protein